MLTPENPSCPGSIVEREPHEKKKENGICTKKIPGLGQGKIFVTNIINRLQGL